MANRYLTGSPDHKDLESALGRAQAERISLNVSWLLKLRWAAVIGQLATILVTAFLVRVELSIVPLLSITAVGAMTNIAVWIWFRETSREERRSFDVSGELLLGSLMVLDIVLLTGLLFISGGAANPFRIFYLVNVVLSALVLRPVWGWLLALLAIVCNALLHADSMPLAALNFVDNGEAAWQTYRLGAFVAFVTATGIVVYFFTRLLGELQNSEQELVLLRQRHARGQRLEAMATLAAGAAHELSSPLSTIAVVAKELERTVEQLEAGPEIVEDAQLIGSEVKRCRRILDRMSVDAGESVGEPLVATTAAELVAEIVGDLVDPARVRVEHGGGSGDFVLRIPHVAVAQALRGIVQNAIDASNSQQLVQVSTSPVDDGLLLAVRDEGEGMDAATLDRIGNPFFTTKEPGRGMGLGVFLARTVVERLAGRIEIESSPGQGTIVSVVLPCERGDGGGQDPQ